jgi:hypothetical protein
VPAVNERSEHKYTAAGKRKVREREREGECAYALELELLVLKILEEALLGLVEDLHRHLLLRELCRDFLQLL